MADNTVPLLPDEVQRRWLETEIPHRVRVLYASTAELNQMFKERFGRCPSDAFPAFEDELAWIKRRCETDAIWEGRLCALRYLIEFVGIKWSNRSSKPVRAETQNEDDCRIDQIAHGQLVPIDSPDARLLAETWRGCTKASSHPTAADDFNVGKDQERMKAVAIIVAHLGKTIYQGRSTWIRDLVLTMRGSDVETRIRPARRPASEGTP